MAHQHDKPYHGIHQLRWLDVSLIESKDTELDEQSELFSYDM